MRERWGERERERGGEREREREKEREETQLVSSHTLMG